MSDRKIYFKTEKDMITKFLNFTGYEEKEIKLVVPGKPSYLEVEPFFSLNRESFREDFTILENKKLKNGEEYIDTISEIVDTSSGEIIVDNLDDNFYVADLSEGGLFRPKKDKTKISKFKPFTYRDASYNWTINTDKGSYGRYRHTFLIKNKGSGEQPAVWELRIDEHGEYDVYFYYGIVSYFKRFLDDEFKFTIYYKDGKEEINYNLKNAKQRWNELGTFEFSTGNHRIELSDKSDKMIIADAVKLVKH